MAFWGWDSLPDITPGSGHVGITPFYDPIPDFYTGSAFAFAPLGRLAPIFVPTLFLRRSNPVSSPTQQGLIGSESTAIRRCPDGGAIHVIFRKNDMIFQKNDIIPEKNQTSSRKTGIIFSRNQTSFLKSQTSFAKNGMIWRENGSIRWPVGMIFGGNHASFGATGLTFRGSNLLFRK